MNILQRSCWLALLALGAAAPAAAQALPEATLAALRTLAGDAAAAGAPQGARIEVQPGALDPRLRLASCSRIDAALLAGARRWGQTRVGLHCAEGSARWNVTLPVTVKVFAPALVASVALPAGTQIEAAHLRIAEVDWAAEPASAHNRAETLTGRPLARPLAAGQAVRSSDLRSRQWFAAGDTVRIVASGAGFSVTGEGQAVSNGIEGQPARVRTESGRFVTGHPTGERRIEVSL